MERDDETLATVLASSESQARAFRGSVAGKGREEGEGNKGRNLGRNSVALKRRKRERERQRQSFTVWTTLLVFFFFNNCPVCPGLPLLTYDGNEDENHLFCLFLFFSFFNI